MNASSSLSRIVWLAKKYARALAVAPCLIAPPVHASGRNGASSALILLRPVTARAMALSGALTSDADDISAFAYNPATLATLKNGDAAALYQKGMADDRFSAVSIGAPIRSGTSLGASAAYYDGGAFDLFDGINHRTVDAKRDLVLSLGAARRWSPIALGVSAKYISSQLIQQARATAVAFDGGIAYLAPHDITLAAACQNMGTNLKYGSESDPLRRIIRVGAAQRRTFMSAQLGISVDGLYSINEKRPDGAIGLEAIKGPLAFRLGYRTGIDLGGLTMGAGFQFRNASLDYALGLMSEYNVIQLVSLSTRFGPASRGDEFARSGDGAQTAKKEPVDIYPPKKRMMSHLTRQVYVIQDGDTLESISQKFYGSRWWSKKLFFANSHILHDIGQLRPGQAIWIP